MASVGPGRRKPYNEINITPMLDLAYVLLVIFILLATASVQGIKVDVPKASSSASLSQPKTVSIAVDNAGQIYFNAYAVSLDELKTRLASEKATNPEVPVIVKGDASVQYQRITAVLDVLRQVDISKVGLVTGKADSVKG
ncbi:MAG: biopolymer transporter ExbD [Sphingomonadaceae bacterium]|nr:biopolymer transporter ExbD [Sphingomonadaceae bacterium]